MDSTITFIFLIVLSVVCVLLLFLMSRYQAEVKKLTTRDPITRIWNQRTTLEYFHREFDTAHRYKLPLTIGLIHVRQLYELQKKYGKSLVNQWMRALSNNLIDELRSTDLIGRLQYDQILVVLTNTNAHNARPVFHRLLDQSRSIKVKQVSARFNIGCSHIHTQSDDWKSIIKEAQEALTQSKLQGANRIYHYNP